MLETDGEKTELVTGETVLIPAILNDVRLTPADGTAKLLEVYIED